MHHFRINILDPHIYWIWNYIIKDAKLLLEVSPGNCTLCRSVVRFNEIKCTVGLFWALLWYCKMSWASIGCKWTVLTKKIHFNTFNSFSCMQKCDNWQVNIYLDRIEKQQFNTLKLDVESPEHIQHIDWKQTRIIQYARQCKYNLYPFNNWNTVQCY